LQRAGQPFTLPRSIVYLFYPVTMTPEDIETLIAAGLPGCEVTVRSDDNTHFEAVVVSSEFAGILPLKRHQLVYKTLGDKMGGEIHALSIQALTPEEQAGH
jgi:acid stress-induced BolA-like protein IbaG/YrbA